MGNQKDELLKDRESELLKDKFIADDTGVTEQTVRRWRLKGEGPEVTTLPGGQKRYTRAAYLAWIKSRTAAPTKSKGRRRTKKLEAVQIEKRQPRLRGSRP